MKTYLLFVGLAFIIFGTQSCLPVFSEMQSARLVGRGNAEITPYISAASIAEDGDSEGIQNEAGVMAALGVGEKMDLRIRYVNVWEKGGAFGDGISALSIGPKFSLMENRIAAYLPVGRALGNSTSDSWEFLPTMLFTVPVIENKLEVTLSPKYIFTFCEDCQDYVALNLGLAISSDLSRWAIRPEYGHLYVFGESGHGRHFSIGVSGVILDK